MDSKFDHWSAYWKGGALTSLPQDFSGNYEGEVADFWSERFAALPDRARILDVCTGNGAIALMAAQARPDATVVALDAAEIHPERAVEQLPALSPVLGKVRFISGVRLEQAEFPDGGFDLLCSQYGLEYSDWEKSAVRIHELLQPGGVLAFVAHAPSSSMVETMKREEAVYDRVFSLAAFDGFRRFSSNPAYSVDAFRRDMQQMLLALRQMTARYENHPLLEQLEQAGQGLLSMPPAQLEKQRPAVGDYRQQLKSGHARLEDMLTVNRRIANNPNWFEVFQQVGFELVRRDTLYYRSQYSCGEAFIFKSRS